jgi:hypothetical protein
MRLLLLQQRLEQMIYIHDCCNCRDSCSLDVGMRCSRCWSSSSTEGLRVVVKTGLSNFEVSTLVVQALLQMPGLQQHLRSAIDPGDKMVSLYSKVGSNVQELSGSSRCALDTEALQ